MAKVPKSKILVHTITFFVVFVALVGAGFVLHGLLGFTTSWLNVSSTIVALGAIGVPTSIVSGSVARGNLSRMKQSLSTDYQKLGTLSNQPEKNSQKINKLRQKIARKELFLAQVGFESKQQYDGIVKKETKQKELGKIQNLIDAVEVAKEYGNLSESKIARIEKKVEKMQKSEPAGWTESSQKRFITTLKVAGMERKDNQVVSLTANGAKFAKEQLEKEKPYIFNKKNKGKLGSEVSVKANNSQEIYWCTNADELAEQHEQAKLSEIAEICDKGEINEKDIFPVTVTRTYYKSENKHETTKFEIENRKALDDRIKLLDDYTKNPSKYVSNKGKISTKRFYEKIDTKDSDMTK